jgi:hypothetical protein
MAVSTNQVNHQSGAHPGSVHRCALCRLAALGLLVCGLLPANATGIATNWNGFAFWLDLPKTNFTAGERVLVSLVVSNTMDTARPMSWDKGNRCNSGLGEFVITDQTSGRRVACPLPPHERYRSMGAGMAELEGHDAKAFSGDLVAGYALTNVGVYSVQAVVGLAYLGVQDQGATLLTPPLVIRLSPRGSASATAAESTNTLKELVSPRSAGP